MENNNVIVAEPKKKNKLIDDLLDIIESTFITVFIVILIMTYFLHPVQIVGTSMLNTLKPDDQVFMSTVYCDLSYGDIIVIDNDCSYLLSDNKNVVKASGGSFEKCIIKRVIAEGGDVLNINFETGEVIVNGKVLKEEFLDNVITTNDYGAFRYPITIPEGYYFVMGDNRNNSCDSRHPNIGLIKKSQVYGKVIMKYAEKDSETNKKKFSFKSLVY
ncbi:MAG: signal peptidase I [Ruminococcus sp.]|nr:signal peptidase I [Ruminococcus sp.]MBO5383601.1 signal peptidase I [Ruminococcus sp.]MBR6669183.1 signal peptidase I [Ruminococcus sp.]